MAQHPVIPLREQFCPSHETGKICMVCKDCELQKVCLTCIATTHQGHRCIQIEDFIKIKKESLKDLITDAKDTETEVQTRLRNTKALSERNSSNTKIIKKQLTRKADRLKQSIDEWLRQSHKECDKLYTANSNIIADVEQKLTHKLNDLLSVIKRSEVALKSTSYEDVTSLEEALSSYKSDVVIPTVPDVNELQLKTVSNVDIAAILGNLEQTEVDLDLKGCQIKPKEIRRKGKLEFQSDMFKGEFNGIPVTIKDLSKPGRNNSEEEVYKEAQILRHIHHPNVIYLHGVIKSKDQPSIVFEDMSKGYLLDFVRAEEEILPLPLILDFSIQVASGMEYVASKRIIHRDLAARNILMVNNSTVKVAEFSMAVELKEDSDQWPPEDNEEMRGPPRMCPIKWSAIEVLEKGVYYIASDVWSFGVLVWETMSQGSRPYQGMSNRDAMSYVTDGHRLPKPQLCPKNVYEVLQKCWDKDLKQRPTFEDLGEMFDTIRQSVQPETPTTTAVVAAESDVKIEESNSKATAENINVSPTATGRNEQRKRSTIFKFWKV